MTRQVEITALESDTHAVRVCLIEDGNQVYADLDAITALVIARRIDEIAEQWLNEVEIGVEQAQLTANDSKSELIVWLSEREWFSDDPDQRKWLYHRIIRFDGTARIPVPAQTLLGEALLEMDEGELPLVFFDVEEG